MAKTPRTTISLPLNKKIELERKAIEISYKTGRSVTWTDLVHFMIENYQTMAKQDMIEEMEKTQKEDL
ncbi:MULTISPECIES: hypothetical protein [Pseudoalteromonas]|uniref:CopG family transcriptional regulator n=1 Tax=Pseudoalteromonas amylolytica TaxID=1859457 RepID=A0A1S1MKQ6_9GAMM|nr:MULTISPECIES: hypothetical protein [Pseudoalteromonas]OHU85482.1 hypothetical protein BFC16_19215 [Pseudoalteromonas sp. JW3]OHU87260.1 hypothetical protein BET10_00070 [Pseudoalteromonas amylolytica]